MRKQFSGRAHHFMNASFQGDLRMVKLLIENGANVNAVNDVQDGFFSFFSGKGKTPLDYAKEQKQSAVIEYLKSKGAK